MVDRAATARVSTTQSRQPNAGCGCCLRPKLWTQKAPSTWTSRLPLSEGETIAVHSSFLPSIERGLSGQDHVYLALASKGLEREMVIYVVVRGADGNHRFPGDCMSDEEELLRQRLGDKYDERLDSVIGSTDRDRILRLLGASP